MSYVEPGRWLGAYDKPTLYRILDLYDAQVGANPARAAQPDIAATRGEVGPPAPCRPSR